jgi:toxin YoeB
VRVLWASKAWEQYLEWQRVVPPSEAQKINELIENIRRDPFKGLGQPEPLRGPLQGWWSRRINREHRLVYRVGAKGDLQTVEIAQCKYHY